MCEAHNHDAAPTHEHEHAAEATPAEGHGHLHSHAAADDGTAECPVMRGNYVDKAEAEAKGLIRDYDGTRYYFCCAACGPLFDADPGKYLATV